MLNALNPRYPRMCLSRIIHWKRWQVGADGDGVSSAGFGRADDENVLIQLKSYLTSILCMIRQQIRLTLNRRKNMGFDLYGLNPKVEKKRPQRPKGMYEEGVPQPTKEVINQYFDELGDYQEQAGTYFRNNVWWWRPLADYIIEFTNCVDEKDFASWHENGGHQVSEADANAIANQLEHLISTGHAKEYADKYEKDRRVELEHNNKIKVLEEQLQEKVKKATGNKNVAPCDYPEQYREEWDRLQRAIRWSANYPFTVDNVKEFIQFARNSGGFEIC